MQFIEFTSTSHNGLINIPDSYKDWYDNTVKVVLFRESKSSSQENDSTELKRFFEQFNADLTNYRFNREQANER